MRGSVQQIPLPLPADLTAGEAQVAQSVAVGAQAGYPTLDCPTGAADFPVPATNDAGPSPSIQHVFFIVRENIATLASGVSHKWRAILCNVPQVFAAYLGPAARSILAVELKISHCCPNRSGCQ